MVLWITKGVLSVLCYEDYDLPIFQSITLEEAILSSYLLLLSLHFTSP